MAAMGDTVKVRCPDCGAKYAVPQSKLGKRAKCTKCLGHFTVAAPADVGGMLGLDDLVGLSQGEAASPPVDPLLASIPEAVPIAAGYARVAPDEDPAPGHSLMRDTVAFMRSVARTPLMFTRLGNVITLFFLCLIVVLQVPAAWAGRMRFSAVLIINGWYMAFLLNLVLNSANGEDDLPEFNLADGITEGIIMPLIKFLAVGLVALIPAIAAIAYSVALDHIALQEGIILGLSVLSLKFDILGAVTPEAAMMIVPAVIAGQLMLPLMMLVVAVGGIGGLVRFDLMIATIVSTLPAYAILLVLYFSCQIAPALLQEANEMAEDVEPTLQHLVFPMAILVIDVILSILSMRAIGLYYHHLKARFAWSWG